LLLIHSILSIEVTKIS